MFVNIEQEKKRIEDALREVEEELKERRETVDSFFDDLYKLENIINRFNFNFKKTFGRELNEKLYAFMGKAKFDANAEFKRLEEQVAQLKKELEKFNKESEAEDVDKAREVYPNLRSSMQRIRVINKEKNYEQKN